MKTRDRSLPGRGTSVSQDWCSSLTEAKTDFFESCNQDHQANYYMLGVTLNEAVEQCRSGQLGSAVRAVSLVPSLCSRWTLPLSALLRAISEHARHHGTLPNAAPLDPRNFQTPRGQNSARLSSLLSHVLLSQRGQFLRKLTGLLDLVEDLTNEFSSTVSQLAEIPALSDSEFAWELFEALARLHCDLNTCSEETMVVLKSFLVALPENQTALFQRTYRAQLRALGADGFQRAIRNGRFVYIGGE